MAKQTNTAKETNRTSKAKTLIREGQGVRMPVCVAAAALCFSSLNASVSAMFAILEGIPFPLRSGNIHSVLVSVAVSAIVALAFACFARHREPSRSFRGTSWFLPTLLIAFALGLGPLWQSTGTALTTASFCLFSIASTIMTFYLLETLKELAPSDVALVILGGALADIPSVWIVNVTSASEFTCALFLLTSFACAWILEHNMPGKARKEPSQDGSTESAKDAVLASAALPKLRIDRMTLSCILGGLFLVGVSVAFTQSAALQSSKAFHVHSELSYIVTFAALVYLLRFGRDINLSLAIKAICTLTMAALLILLLSANYAQLSYLLSSIAYGILANVAYYAAVLIAKSRAFAPLRVFGITEFMLDSSSLVLIALELAGIEAAAPRSICVLGFVFMCAVIWLLTDRGVDMLLATEPHEQPSAQQKREDFTELAHTLSRTANLTSRETDVMVLYSIGRSAPFIAEKLALSENTVKSYLQRVYSKCGVHSRQELISLIEQQAR